MQRTSETRSLPDSEFPTENTPETGSSLPSQRPPTKRETGWDELERKVKETAAHRGEDKRAGPPDDYLVSRNKFLAGLIVTVLLIASLAAGMTVALLGSKETTGDIEGAGDADNDGLVDAQEIKLGTKVEKRDTDGDGLSDGDEFAKYRTDPLDADTDNDGIADGWEDANGNGRWEPDEGKGEIGDPNGNPPRIRSGANGGTNPGSTGTDPLDGDSDDDGVSDHDEIFKYFTDPVDTNDIINRTGVLFYDPTLVNHISESVPEDIGYEGLLVTGLNGKGGDPEPWSKHVDVYRIEMRGERPAVVNGSFVLIKTDPADTAPVYKIKERELSDTIEVSGIKDLTSDPERYAFQNIVVNEVRTTGVVYENHTVGISNTPDIFWYLALDMCPALATESSLEGVYVPESFYSNLDIVLDIHPERELPSFFRKAGKMMEEHGAFTPPRFLLLASSAEYVGNGRVSGDALDVIDPEQVASETLHILGEDPGNFRLLFDLIEDTNMQLVVLGDVNNSVDSGEFTLLLAPRTFDRGDLRGEVTFDNVSSVGRGTLRDVLEQFLGEDIYFPEVEVGPPWSIRIGVTSDGTPEVGEYTDAEVSDLWDLISSGPTAVSADSHFTMTKLSDVIEYVSDAAGLGEEEEEMLLKMTNYRDPAFCVMIDNEIDPSELESADDIIRNIAFAVVPDANQDALLLRGDIEGMLYDLGEKLGRDDLDMPFIISDRVDIWDDLAEVEFSELAESPSDHVATEENELMVEMEGHVVGTTLKTVAEYLGEVYPVFKVIEYLPFDIGIYDLSGFDMNTLTLYHLPTVAVVHGKGETYVGQYMRVRGWFDVADPGDLFRNMTDELNESGKLPAFMLDYLDDHLSGDIRVDISEYALEHLTAELGDFMDTYLPDLEEHVREEMIEFIEGLKGNLSEELDQIRDDLTALVEGINGSVEEVGGGIRNNLTRIREELSNLRSDLQNHSAELPDKLSSLFDSYNDFLIRRLPEDMKANITGITDLMVTPIRDYLENNLGNYKSGFLSSLGYSSWEEYVDNEFDLDLMISNVTGLIDRVDTIMVELPGELDDIVEGLIELLGLVHIMDDSVIREFDDYVDNLSGSVSDWFDEFGEENLMDNITELARRLAEDLTEYIGKLNDFFDNGKLAEHYVTVSGYIQIYELAPAW